MMIIVFSVESFLKKNVPENTFYGFILLMLRVLCSSIYSWMENSIFMRPENILEKNKLFVMPLFSSNHCMRKKPTKEGKLQVYNFSVTMRGLRNKL